MYILFTILVLIYSIIHVVCHDLEILASGLGKISEKHMLMEFYVTVYHHGVSPQRVILTMIECCEVLMEGEVDCDFMKLYGSNLLIIAPKKTENLTMYYPNMYTYNRKGWCILKLYHHTSMRWDVNAIRHKITFDTSVWKHPLPQVVRSFRNSGRLPKCDTSDLDPFDHCNPVNCLIKYSGYRNYYNRKSKRCQKVPVCISDMTKELPDVVYVPTINICRNLTIAVTEEDRRQILRGITETNNFEDQLVNIQCHHGAIDPRTGLCVCDYGWKSEPFDPDLYNPNSVYSMCNVKCYPNAKSWSTPKVVYFLVGIFLALWIASCVMCFDSYGLSNNLTKCSENRSSAGASSQKDYDSPKGNVEEDECDTRHEPDMICNRCQNQCPLTVQGANENVEDDHSLWDITR